MSEMLVFPFVCPLVDMDQFELDIQGYLRAYTAGKYEDITIFHKWGN